MSRPRDRRKSVEDRYGLPTTETTCKKIYDNDVGEITEYRRHMGVGSVTAQRTIADSYFCQADRWVSKAEIRFGDVWL